MIFSAAVVKDLPLAGGQERPLRPLDQLHPEPVFQLTHNLAGPRLRNAIVLGRTGKAAASNDIAEDFQGLDIHGMPRKQPEMIKKRSLSSLTSIRSRNQMIPPCIIWKTNTA
jgi:hypothetical protein